MALGVGAVGYAQPERQREERRQGPERQAEMPAVDEQLGHRWRHHRAGGSTQGHAQGIPGDHAPDLIMEMALDETGEQGPRHRDAGAHDHGAADQHAAGMAAQARQQREADQAQAGGDHPLQTETHRQARRQGCEQPHAEHRQCGGQADQAATQGQFFSDAFDQGGEGGDAGPQVDGGKHQRQHQQRAGKGFHGESIRVGSQAGGATLLPRPDAGQPRTMKKLTGQTTKTHE
ncbi:hypothetical protein FQZ97_855080 [compost metagenome]